MKCNWRLTDEQKQEASKLYDAGLSLADIAKVYGVTRQSMHEVLKRRTTMRSQKRTGHDNHFWRHGRERKIHGRVHDIFEKALAKGLVERQEKCEECGYIGKFKDGRAGVHAHHNDYNKPLAVRWLCYKCHYDWHKKNKAVAMRQN